MLLCQECKSYFAETHGTVISGLGTPLNEIAKVLKNRMEGMGLNAAARTFGYSKKKQYSIGKRNYQDYKRGYFYTP